MNCSQCSHRNPIGNKFCRECGAALVFPQGPLAVEEVAVAERERLSERVAGLLGAAFTLAEQKRYAQALPIAEEAVLLLPQSTAALTLLATLYEHTAQWDKAVAAMERVVALNPESPADRQKLESLRRGGTEKPAIGRPASEGADRPPTGAAVATVGRPTVHWAPFVVSGAAAACVLAIGLSLLTSRHERAASGDRGGVNAGTNAPLSTSASPAANNTVAAEISSALPAANSAPGTVTVAASTVPHESPPASETRVDPFATTGSNPNMANPMRTSARGSMGLSLPPLHTSSRHGYASAGFSTGDSDAATTPLPPILVTPPNRSSANFGATQSGFGNGTRIAVGPPTAGGSGTDGTIPASAPAASVDTGYIHISVGPPVRASSSSRGGSAPMSGDEAPMARARRQQSGGQYGEAIHSYQQSLNGANGGEVYEGIGQCYERLGNASAARDAYKRAIQSYQDARGTPASQRGTAACKAALEALGEN